MADDAATYAVWRLALDSLFDGREHARRVVLWSNDAGNGPVLEALGAAVPRPGRARPIDASRLAARLPTRVMPESELEALFRRHPDAWAAFFGENPGAAGLVELSAVRVWANGRVAVTYVGRSCGEHCRNAWRVTALRGSDARWRVDSLAWIAPRDRRRF